MWCAHVEHRCAPFHGVGHGQADRLARFGDCGIDRQAFGQRLVKRSREFHRGPIGDLVLHGDDGWQAAPHQDRRRAGENIVFAAARPFARIQQRQTQRSMIGQQAAQLGRQHPMGAAVLIGQRDHALIGVAVKSAVTDEVKDVPRTAAHRSLQVAPRLPLQPLQIDQALFLQIAQRCFHALLLARHSSLQHK